MHVSEALNTVSAKAGKSVKFKAASYRIIPVLLPNQLITVYQAITATFLATIRFET